MSEMTQLMTAVERGESHAEEVLALVYCEVCRLAILRLAQEKPGQTLQTTTHVNEAWLGWAEPLGQSWKSKGHCPHQPLPLRI